MPPKFGTSGLRGLVTELTTPCVTGYVQAFLSSCPVGSGLLVGHDLRPSSAGLADIVAQAARAGGVPVTLCGPVPTPALALGAMTRAASAIMVTGSHIPADRNGLKFYTPSGEITKQQEKMILKALGQKPGTADTAALGHDTTLRAAYADRYLCAYRDALRGLRIGLYEHSAVGRDDLAVLLRSLGAKVTALGRSDVFVPVDTEAVPGTLRNRLRGWAQTHHLDAIVSTDADGDRPLLTDQFGGVVPGDILGQITAAALQAEAVVTPVSSNTGVELTSHFGRVIRTAIGSPHVIAAMGDCQGRVAGYEANGGFLLGFEAQGPSGPIAPLMTRDAILPLVAVLAAASGDGVAALVQGQPARFTATDRLQDVAADAARALMQRLRQDAGARAAFLSPLDTACDRIDETDGLRMTLADGRIVHLRPSGNAPEMRLYVEAPSRALADATLQVMLPCLERAVVSTAL